MHYQGLSYIPEVIWTELTCRHHDKGTLALRKLEDLLPRKNSRPAVATYRLKGHESRLGQDCLCHWEGHELLFDSRRWLALEDITQWAGADTDWCTPASQLNCQWLRLSLHLQVLVLTASLSDSAIVTRLWAQLWLPPTYLLWKYQLGSYDYMQKELSALACDIVNLFLLDFWGYVHGCSY